MAISLVQNEHPLTNNLHQFKQFSTSLFKFLLFNWMAENTIQTLCKLKNGTTLSLVVYSATVQFFVVFGMIHNFFFKGM